MLIIIIIDVDNTINNNKSSACRIFSLKASTFRKAGCSGNRAQWFTLH